MVSREEVRKSIEKILKTKIGDRVMRKDFGRKISELIKNEIVFIGEHFFIIQEPKKTNRSTHQHSIVNYLDGEIGRIKWYGAWRQYCFFPNEDTVWSRGCIREVHIFINNLTEERKVANNKIEKAIPIPLTCSQAKWPTVFDNMEIDDSIFFDDEKEARSFQSSICMKYGKKKLKSRLENGGIRIWRID